MYRSSRISRWLASVIGAGLLLQVGMCNLDPNTSGAIASEVVRPQLANLIADTVFFFLDNALVRLTA